MGKSTQPNHPIPSVFNKDFVYKVAAKTDITETFRRFGWVPPSEQPIKKQERK